MSLPVAPSLEPALSTEHVRRNDRVVDRRVLHISALAIALAVVAALVAQLLAALIALCTNVAFYGQVSTQAVAPAGHQLGWWSIGVPVIGGLIIGLMARFGSKAIRGHGIPEAMEQVLVNESRIPRRMTFLKPLSAAISIGTGGPFGAEGPIIATGGALGSWLGQVLHITANERKTLLAAGAAAGMAATFGSPVAAVLLAVELLLFEFHPRSLLPVGLAATTATAVRMVFSGAAPAFVIPELGWPAPASIAFYVVLGALVGVVSVLVTRAVYAVEDTFERLPVHWMWWPAIGGLVVGIVGVIEPRTMGVGYDNIEHILSGSMLPPVVLALCGLKFLSWVIALGSGTSGGTLAPLFTFGGGLGAVIGVAFATLLPAAGVDPRMAALVGMAAMFAGASRALMASVVFAFETTHQSAGVLPLLGGCVAAFLVASLLMRNSIMTEKIARRGVRAQGAYQADRLATVTLRDLVTRPVVTLSGSSTIAHALNTARHQAWPVVDAEGQVMGVVTRRELLAANDSTALVRTLIRRAPIVISDDCSMREAADCMAKEKLGRLPVLSAEAPHRLVGIVTRTDVVHAHA